MTTIILHIGAPRTGTTALQRILARHRDLLSHNGYCYPFAHANHQRMAWDIYTRRISPQDVSDMLAPYSLFDQIILSAEHFCRHRDLSWLQSLKANYDIRAVFYIRRQDDWAMSWYNQHVKWPVSRRYSKMTHHKFISILSEFHWINYYITVNNWIEALGRDNVCVKVVEKGRVEDVVKDFCEHIGVDGLTFKNQDDKCGVNHLERGNDSVPVACLDAARHLGLIKFKKKDRIRMINTLRVVYGASEMKYRTLFSAAERRQILEIFREPNSKLAEEYFGRKYLFDEVDINDEQYLDMRQHREYSLSNNVADILYNFLYNDRIK